MKIITVIIFSLLFVTTQAHSADVKEYAKYRDGTYILTDVHGMYIAPKHIFNREFFEVTAGYLVGSIEYILANKANGAPANLVKQNISVDDSGFNETNRWMKVYVERILQFYVHSIYGIDTPNLDRNFDLYVSTLEKNLYNNFINGAKKYLKDEWDNQSYDEYEEYGD